MKTFRLVSFIVSLFVLVSCESCPRVPSTPGPTKVTIASFNLEVFGPTKAGNAVVLGIMGQIIRRYDIVAVQEIRDSSGTAVVALKNAVNSTGVSYDYEIGPREGRTTSKEQYAFFYNTATIEVLPGAYVFNEGGTDTFEREPYVARFKARGGAFDFTLIDIHTKPEDATAEITYLPTVISQAVTTTGEPDVICLGDFNADGSYYDESAYSSVFPSSTYNWLISNAEDTTVASSSNTYDRIVTTKSIDEDFTANAGVFRFDQQFGLDATTVSSVSDHYPVWAEFATQKDTD